MVYKNQLQELQEFIKSFNAHCLHGAGGHEVIASDETSLVVYGILDNIEMPCFDVSSAIFTEVAKKWPVDMSDKLNPTSIIDGRVKVRLGRNLGITVVDGIYVYDIASLETRFAIYGRGMSERCTRFRRFAEELANMKDEMRQARAKGTSQLGATCAQVERTAVWGALDEAEATYEALCKKADWYYSYSDDHSVFKRGREECAGLEKTANVNGGNYKLIYNYYSNR